MTRGARACLLLAAGAASLAPLKASGHSSEFILVKVTPENGGVQLEMTADYGGNPMIASEEEAREALTHLFRVRIGARTRELGALAPVRLERRAHFDPAAPIPHDPETDAEAHQLLCGVWWWRCTAAKIAFELPESVGQSVILWTQAGGAAKPRWVFMVGGDVSPAIVIPQRPAPIWGIAGIALVGLGMAITLARGAGRAWRETVPEG
jgi:hypothetical protein